MSYQTRVEGFCQSFANAYEPTTGWEFYEQPQKKGKNMNRDRKENPQFIESMKIVKNLRAKCLTEEMENQLRAIKAMLIRQNDEIHDLKTALSKSDRKCNALNDMIQCVAEKNGGLKHRIKRLQSLIAQNKRPEVDGESAIMASMNDIQEAIEFYMDQSELDSDYVESLHESVNTVRCAITDYLQPVVTTPLVVESDDDGLILKSENTES